MFDAAAERDVLSLLGRTLCVRASEKRRANAFPFTFQLPVESRVAAQLRRPLLRGDRQAPHALVFRHQLQRDRPVRLRRSETSPQGKSRTVDPSTRAAFFTLV